MVITPSGCYLWNPTVPGARKRSGTNDEIFVEINGALDSPAWLARRRSETIKQREEDFSRQMNGLTSAGVQLIALEIGIAHDTLMAHFAVKNEENRRKLRTVLQA